MDNKARQILKEQIKIYLLENELDRSKPNCYKDVADKFGVHSEYVRSIYRKLRAKGLVEATEISIATENKSLIGKQEFHHYGDLVEFEKQVDREIKTLEDLIEVCEIDLNEWTIERWECKKWDLGIKNAQEAIETKALFSVRAKLKKKTVDNSLDKQKELILNELKKQSQYRIYSYDGADFENQKGDCCLEIAIPDLHIGKLAWSKESGEDYDIKIACKRFRDAIDELIGRTDITSIDRILLPVGNDLINVDSKANMTTAGTPQSCDSRFGKMFQAAKELLIEAIDKLSTIAPVDVVIIPGNHDQVTTFTLGEVLEAWYHNNERVSVSNTHAPRKYYKYGKNLIMYVHGDREKLNDLGIICATEQKKLWAATKYRRAHVGHFHHNKQIKFTDIQEYPGFTVKILNSLSANDAWHAEKGFLSLKMAEAFLYHKDKGLLANYYYQV